MILFRWLMLVRRSPCKICAMKVYELMIPFRWLMLVWYNTPVTLQNLLPESLSTGTLL